MISSCEPSFPPFFLLRFFRWLPFLLTHITNITIIMYIYIYFNSYNMRIFFSLFFFILTLSFFCGDYSHILLNHIPWRLRLAALSTRFSTRGIIITGSTLQTSIMVRVKVFSTISFWRDNNLSCLASTSSKSLDMRMFSRVRLFPLRPNLLSKLFLLRLAEFELPLEFLNLCLCS